MVPYNVLFFTEINLWLMFRFYKQILKFLWNKIQIYLICSVAYTRLLNFKSSSSTSGKKEEDLALQQRKNVATMYINVTYCTFCYKTLGLYFNLLTHLLYTWVDVIITSHFLNFLPCSFWRGKMENQCSVDSFPLSGVRYGLHGQNNLWNNCCLDMFFI